MGLGSKADACGWLFEQNSLCFVTLSALYFMKKLSFLFLLSLAVASLSVNLATAAENAPETAPYPLKTCVVSGEKLGSMGKSFVHTYEGREVQFCCKACLKDFNKDPQKYLKKLADAAPKTKS